MKKRLLVLLLALVMVISLAACGGDKNGKLDTDVFRVGMEAGYPPFNWTQKDDSNGAVPIEGSPEFANGYDVQMAKKVAEGLGKEMVVVKTEWDGLVPALISGKIDAIMAGMSPTAERAKKIDFSEAYYSSDLVLVVKNDGPYANAGSKADFNGAKVVAQLNTFHDTVVDQIEGVNHLTPMSDFPVMRVAVQSGKADAYVAERPEAEAAEKANVGLKMILLSDGFEASPEDTQISVGLKKGSELREKINEILSKVSVEERNALMSDMQDKQPKE